MRLKIYKRNSAVRDANIFNTDVSRKHAKSHHEHVISHTHARAHTHMHACIIYTIVKCLYVFWRNAGAFILVFNLLNKRISLVSESQSLL